MRGCRLSGLLAAQSRGTWDRTFFHLEALSLLVNMMIPAVTIPAPGALALGLCVTVGAPSPL